MIRRESFIELEFAPAGPRHILGRDLRRCVNFFVRVGAHEPAQQTLAFSLSVSPRSIKKIATKIHGTLQRAKRLFVIGAGPTSHAPHSIANFTDQPVSPTKATIVHGIVRQTSVCRDLIHFVVIRKSTN